MSDEETVKVNLRLRGMKGPGTQCCFELPRGGEQAWVSGTGVISVFTHLQVGSIVEVELLRSVAEANKWLL